MITAEQARELGKVSSVTVSLAMAAVEQDIKAVAAASNTVLHTGMASVDLAPGQTPCASALMVCVKQKLEENGFKVSYEVTDISPKYGMVTLGSHRKYALRINWEK